MGFSLPFKDWFRDKRGFGRHLELLSDSTFRQRGFYNDKLVEKTIKEHLSTDFDRSKEMFVLVAFENWHRQFIDK